MPRVLDGRIPRISKTLHAAPRLAQLRSADELNRQLAYVCASSGFYRERFRMAGRTRVLSVDDLPFLPFTTRADLQADQEAHPPFGNYLAAPTDRVARVHRTSGSTGPALLIALSMSDIERSVVAGAECFRAAGVGSGDLIVHCLNYCMWSGGLTDHQALERSGAGVIPYGVGKSSELIEMIRRIRPTGLHCTPSYLGRLEERLAADFGLAPRDLGLRIGLFGGEGGLQEPAFRNRIEQTWGIRAMDANYGMSEVLSMFGAECEARCGLHFFGDESLFAELKALDSDETSPMENGASGELVLTHRGRECQPLVRYRTSDIIEVTATEPCSCGRTSPRFRVIGRVDDMLVIRGINVFPGRVVDAIHRFSDRLTGEYRVQVSREAPIQEFRVVVEERSPGASPRLAAELADALEKSLSIRPTIQLVAAGTFPRTSGKTCRVERTL
ncbi:MAG: AMP-binding protein [Planctomycetes bacterium]|nr:AMP-binding protein [Planctomycetota bacterium]